MYRENLGQRFASVKHILRRLEKVTHLIASEPTFNFKIKRSGPEGSLFTIKKRQDPKLAAAEARLEENLEKSRLKSQKSSKKKSKK